MKLPGRAVKRPPGANKNRRGDMQYHDNILCVEAGWMIEVGVMSFDNYKQLKCRKDIQILNRGCRNTPALVAYDSMPERFKRKILALVGDPYKAVKTNILETFITPSTEASHFFETHKTGGDSHLPSDKRRQYYADAIILDAMHRMIDDRQARRAALGGKTTRFWEQLSQAAQDIDRTRYPHNLPTNPRSLERKYKDYMKNGYEALIHSAYKNPTANAAKVFTEEQIGVMVTVMGDPRKYDDAQCAEWYNAIAKVRNESNPDSEQWKPITRSTVSVWRRKLASTILARRNGDIEFMNTLTMQVKRRAPKHPLLYWTLDGWNAELLYQSVRNGRTIYHERLAIEVVLDACTKYPIGYAIGTHENPDLIRAALRNAARHTEELFGQMYRTAQIQSDRYQITQMTPTYAAISEIVTPAQAHNAKAKIIEPWFKYFNKKYCQPQKNWSGYGITSRRELQPNSSFLNKYRGEFPTMEQLVVELADMINTERARLRDEYLRRFNAMPTDKLIPMTREDFLLNFGTTTSLKNLMQPSTSYNHRRRQAHLRLF